MSNNDNANKTKADGRAFVETDPLIGSDQPTGNDHDDNNNNDNDTPLFPTVIRDTMENIAENVELVVENTQQTLQETLEDMQDQAQQVQQTLQEELEQADDGGMDFFDMALTRNLSLLPEDLQNAANEQARQEEERHQQEIADAQLDLVQKAEQQRTMNGGVADPEAGGITMEDKKKLYQQEVEGQSIELAAAASNTSTPLSAYILLATAVISLSSIGPLLELQQGVVSPTLKITWRMAGTAILLVPTALRDVCTKPHLGGVANLTVAQWITFLWATFAYVTMGVGFVLALQYTAVGNAVILANSLALILLLGKLCVGDPIAFSEGAGALIAFAGCVLCSSDAAENVPDDHGASSVIDDEDASDGGVFRTLWGDFLAILSAIGGVGYLIFAKTTRPHLTIHVFTFLTMTIGTLMCVLFQLLIMREPITFDMNRRTGMWGFLSLDHDRLPLELTMVLVCNVLGTMVSKQQARTTSETKRENLYTREITLFVQIPLLTPLFHASFVFLIGIRTSHAVL